MLKTAVENAKSPPASHGEDLLPETVIEPVPAWRLLDLAELWRYRELLYFLAWRDIKVRYKQTALGAAWAVLQPGLMMVVFSIVLGRMAKVPAGDLPYPLFVYVGLLPWSFFATVIANGGNSVVDSERLITKVYFPRLAIPFAAVGAALVDFTIACGLLLALLACYGVWPAWTIVLAPVALAPVVLAALGVAALLAALNVAYRDFRYVIPFLTQLWLFATPSIYMDTTALEGSWLSSPWRVLVAVNPMEGLIALFRAAVLGGEPTWGIVAAGTAMTALLFAGGCFYFRRVEDTFADII